MGYKMHPRLFPVFFLSLPLNFGLAIFCTYLHLEALTLPISPTDEKCPTHEPTLSGT